MQTESTRDWHLYVSMMEQVLDVPLDDARRAELLNQFHRIAKIAVPLLGHSLAERQEIAGIYKP